GPSEVKFEINYGKIATVMSYINREFVHEHCRRAKSSQCPIVDKIELYQMPYPAYEQNGSTNISFVEFLGLFTVFGFVLSVPIIVKRITDEKSAKVKEMLRMIGMSDFVFWSSHFIN